jgi:hypothetical protein
MGGTPPEIGLGRDHFGSERWMNNKYQHADGVRKKRGDGEKGIVDPGVPGFPFLRVLCCAYWKGDG